MAVGDIWQASIVCGFQAQVAFNVYHYRVEVEVGLGVSASAVAATADATFQAAMRQLLSNEATYSGCIAQKIFPTPMGMPAMASGGGGVGLVVGDALPKQVAGIIAKITAFAGRAFRGRAFVPFPSEADNDNASRPTADYCSRLAILGGIVKGTLLVIDGLNNAGLTPQILHRASMTVTPIVDAFDRKFWATQRRRGDFGRINTMPGGLLQDV